MWYRLGKWILKFRLLLLVILLSATGFLGYFAGKVQLSYDFTRAIPADNEKYLQFEAFKQKFGDNGGLLVLGVESNKLYSAYMFNALISLNNNLKKVKGVENVLSVPDAVMLLKNDTTNRLLQ